jgi:hypothetical protein
MVQIFFRKIESSALFIPLVHKPPMFQNPNLMDELLDFGILSILKKFKKTKSNNNRHFGGIAILIKSYIKPHVKILENTNVDYQRVKLEKTFFGFKKDKIKEV